MNIPTQVIQWGNTLCDLEHRYYEAEFSASAYGNQELAETLGAIREVLIEELVKVNGIWRSYDE